MIVPCGTYLISRFFRQELKLLPGEVISAYPVSAAACQVKQVNQLLLLPHLTMRRNRSRRSFFLRTHLELLSIAARVFHSAAEFPAAHSYSTYFPLLRI
jgi:hypothetical protein